MFWWIVAVIVGVPVVYAAVVGARVRTCDRGIERTWGRIQEQLTQRESAVRELIALAREVTGQELPWEATQAALERAREVRDSSLAASQVQEALTKRTVELIEAMSAPSEPEASLRWERALKMLARAEERVARFRKIFERSVRANNALVDSLPGGLIARLFGCRLREYYPADDRLMARALKGRLGRPSAAERR